MCGKTRLITTDQLNANGHELPRSNIHMFGKLSGWEKQASSISAPSEGMKLWHLTKNTECNRWTLDLDP